jgi:hypothetical protein
MDCHFLLGCALAFTQISVKAMHKLSQRNVKNTLQYNIWPPQTVTQSHCSVHSAYKCISHIASPSQQKVDTFVHLLAPGASQSLWNNREWIGNKFGASEKRRNKFEQIIYIYISKKKCWNPANQLRSVAGCGALRLGNCSRTIDIMATCYSDN